jgi:glycosyltransferase involved in cell wall biosynthesis
MDLFVLSSFSEGTSMALLEAMAAGVPVAVTDVGGNPEIVLKGSTGWVVPSGSIDELSAAIHEAVENPQKRIEFGINGRRRAAENFSFDGMLQNYRFIYQEMAGKAGLLL